MPNESEKLRRSGSDSNIDKTAAQSLPGDKMDNRLRADQLTAVHKASEENLAAKMKSDAVNNDYTAGKPKK